MSKTLEINEAESHLYNFEIVTPDHDEAFDVNSYEFLDPFKVLHEAGRASINISNDQFFHIEVTDANDGHAKISVSDKPQPTEHEFVAPYRCGYTFGELVSECGVPDTDQAHKALKYLPTVRVDMTYSDGEVSVEAVEVDGDIFERQ